MTKIFSFAAAALLVAIISAPVLHQAAQIVA